MPKKANNDNLIRPGSTFCSSPDADRKHSGRQNQKVVLVYTVILPIITAPRGIQELRGSSFGFRHCATPANQPSPPRNHAPERMAAVLGRV